jgi:hypothetical protein
VILARPRPKFYKKGPDVGSKADRTRRRYRDLLAGQQMLEDFGFMRAEPRSRSTASPSPCPSSPTTTSSAVVDQTMTDNDDSKMADDPTAPNQPEAIPEFKVKVEDEDYSPSPGHRTLLHLSETEDDIHVRQETPDPPVLEFDV